MRATRRRERKTDPLATTAAVQDVLAQLRSALPDIVPRQEKSLIRMLRAVRHVQRYPASDTKRGRPSKWKREDLLQVLSHLTQILERETASHISVSSFVDHYLRLLEFPSDVNDALHEGEINLFEAEQLARLTPERLQVTPAEAKRARASLLTAHLQMKGSGERLRLRINELLRAPAETGASASGAESSTRPATDTQPPEQMEDFDPYDSTHLFWEQIKQLGFAFREIRPEDVSDEDLAEILKASEPVLTLLNRIRRRKEHRQSMKFSV